MAKRPPESLFPQPAQPEAAAESLRHETAALFFHNRWGRKTKPRTTRHKSYFQSVKSVII